MRPDVVTGAVIPDYELPDHTAKLGAEDQHMARALKRFGWLLTV